MVPVIGIVNAAQKMKFSIKDFFRKCYQIRSFLRVWSHLLKKSLMENFIFCAVKYSNLLRTQVEIISDANYLRASSLKDNFHDT